MCRPGRPSIGDQRGRKCRVGLERLRVAEAFQCPSTGWSLEDAGFRGHSSLPEPGRCHWGSLGPGVHGKPNFPFFPLCLTKPLTPETTGASQPVPPNSENKYLDDISVCYRIGGVGGKRKRREASSPLWQILALLRLKELEFSGHMPTHS